eukprot:9078366-Pyramimonas_sp.AAC.1
MLEQVWEEDGVVGDAAADRVREGAPAEPEEQRVPDGGGVPDNAPRALDYVTLKEDFFSTRSVHLAGAQASARRALANLFSSSVPAQSAAQSSASRAPSSQRPPAAGWGPLAPSFIAQLGDFEL